METVITISDVLAAAELPAPEQSEMLQAATRGLGDVLTELINDKQEKP